MAIMQPIGIQCPVCEKIVNIPVKVSIKDPEFAYLGMAELIFEPDMAKLQAHMFKHQLDDTEAIAELGNG